MSKQLQKEMAAKAVADMRAAQSGDWVAVLSLYDQFLEFPASKGLRLEAGCMAVRALVASGRRREAREVMRALGDNEYARAVHYEFLARAFLELKKYSDAAQACERAETLRFEEQQARSEG